jgi:acetyl esterase/lipase
MAESAQVLPFPQAPDAIELRHLRAFVAVAEELNFGRAAERLFISQPALSRQIRGLEQLLGCELLRRSTRQVELTMAGEALLDRARKLLAYVDEAVTATLAVGGELLGRIAKMWEPIEDLMIDNENLHATRQAFEEFHARFEPPAGTSVRPVTAGGVPSLVVSSAVERDPTVIYIHGGAFVIGSAYGYRVHAGALAAAAHTGVLVPDYRLAPEHPFPAAVEDAANAYEWLVARGIAPETIALVGDSAGASITLSLLQRLRQSGGELPGAVVVMCPWLDLALRPGSDGATAADADVARQCAAAYLGGQSAADPVVNPLEASLSGMPPMLIQAATGDNRLADAKVLAERALAHGVDARLDLYPVDAHAFQLFWSFLPEAAHAIQNAGRFIQERATSATRSAAG